jgi:hypothetical protein
MERLQTHWARQTNPFTLQVGDNVSAARDPYLTEAINDWNQVALTPSTPGL